MDDRTDLDRVDDADGFDVRFTEHRIGNVDVWKRRVRMSKRIERVRRRR